MVVLFLNFPGTSILFPIMAVPNYIPTNSVQGFSFLHTLAFVELKVIQKHYPCIVCMQLR